MSWLSSCLLIIAIATTSLLLISFKMAATLASSVTAAVSDVYRSLTHSDAPLKATFQRLEAPSIPRSSHTINVVGKRASTLR